MFDNQKQSFPAWERAALETPLPCLSVLAALLLLDPSLSHRGSLKDFFRMLRPFFALSSFTSGFPFHFSARKYGYAPRRSLLFTSDICLPLL